MVICLFSNSDIGNDLASGKLSRISTVEHRDAWLGMYTYNPVEGAYFDDKPGGYLGYFNYESKKPFMFYNNNLKYC